ncbi:MAG TPA: hypothetical protein VLG49_02010, partial [Rhabdochlamydiaceae bacterium]|nr:hypothetical protein [Rhabdochlamydiaceae bacterium]
CIAAIFVILTSSANFRTGPFSFHPSDRSVFDLEKNLIVTSKIYTAKDCKKYLNKNLIRFGFHPVEITIQNNTSHSYSIGFSDVGLPIASAGEVVSKIVQRAIPKGIALKAASLLFWPFNIPCTIDGLKDLKQNAAVRYDLAAKSLKKDETILPYSIVSRVLFIPTDKFKKEFDIKIRDLSKGAPVTIHIAATEAEIDSQSVVAHHESESRYDRALGINS